MKKNWKLLAPMTAVLLIALFAVQCGKEEGSKYSKLSGKVTLADGSEAGGAIVSVSKEPNAADVIGNTVADADGNFSFASIENGTYYVNARFEPSNNNNTFKSAGTVILTGAESEVSLSGDKTVDIVLTGAVSDGTNSFDYPTEWEYDATHSRIEFDFPYDVVNALFNGNFARTGVDLFVFDEQNPESLELKAWVDLVSIETGAGSPPGSHGRDGIIGCIATTFKVDLDEADTVDAYTPSGELLTDWPNEELEAFDLWGDGSATFYEKQSSIVGTTGVATLEAKDVTSYGTGYVATCDFTFAGVTKEIKLYFNVMDGYEAENRQGVLTKYSSVYGWFKFAAAADFGITSGHVGDAEITVKMSVQFTKALI